MDELEEVSAERRAAIVEEILRAPVDAVGAETRLVLPDQVLAASAIVAANTPEGATLPWNDEHPHVAGWLPKPVPPSVAMVADRALEIALASDSWYWRSWVDDEERVEAQEAVDTLRRTLQHHASG